MVKHDLRPRALLRQFEFRNRIAAGLPVHHAPGLHDALIRHQLDVSALDVASKYRERPAHFTADCRNSCPVVALPTDVARSGVAARRAFKTVFRAMVSFLERSTSHNGKARRATAQSVAAICIGGMIVARTIVDRELADELRNSCMKIANQLAGWKENSNTNFNDPKRSIRRSRHLANES
jgi:hypothetical protein